MQYSSQRLHIYVSRKRSVLSGECVSLALRDCLRVYVCVCVSLSVRASASV